MTMHQDVKHANNKQIRTGSEHGTKTAEEPNEKKYRFFKTTFKQEIFLDAPLLGPTILNCWLLERPFYPTRCCSGLKTRCFERTQIETKLSMNIKGPGQALKFAMSVLTPKKNESFLLYLLSSIWYLIKMLDFQLMSNLNKSIGSLGDVTKFSSLEENSNY